MMKYEDCKNMVFDLSSIGGNRPYTLEELVEEIVSTKRERFFKYLFRAKEKENKMSDFACFEAMGFIAAMKDFDDYLIGEGFEGEIVYEVIAGGDWVWHCKTKITWRSALPIVGGYLNYHTEVVPGENVNPYRVNAMTGTSCQIKVLEDNLKKITYRDAKERDSKNFK